MKQILVCNSHRQAVVYLIIAAMLWSTGGLFVKIIDWHPLAIAGVRSLCAAIVIATLCRKPDWHFSKVQVTGAVGYAVMVILFVVATKLTTAANAILLQYTAPVYVAILAGVFLQERTSRLDWISVVGVSLGMILFFLDDVTIGNVMGNISGIVSGMGFATMAICLRKEKNGRPVDIVILGNIFTFLVGLPFMFEHIPGSSGLLAIIFLGTMQLGVSYVVYTAAVKYVTALEAVMVPLIEPLMNPVWVYFMIGEIPGYWSFWGGLVILTAVLGKYIWQIKSSRTTQSLS